MIKTPETDVKWQELCCSNLSWYHIAENIKAHCQKKERERDEARKKYDTLATEHMLVVNKLCEERDELLNEIKRLRLENQREAEHHDRMVGELEKVYKERDEAIRQLDETSKSSKYACDYNYEQKLKAERERDEARELVKAYQDYTQLLGDEINDMASVAYVHGWRSNRYEQGKVLREKIKQLEEAK